MDTVDKKYAEAYGQGRILRMLEWLWQQA